MGPDSGPSLRHFLDLDRIERATLRRIIDAGCRFKQAPRYGSQPLAGKALALIFEKPSTRTRVSFELAMRQLGGDVIVLERDGSQLGRGETVADTARVLSRYVDAIMLRTTKVEKLQELAARGCEYVLLTNAVATRKTLELFAKEIAPHVGRVPVRAAADRTVAAG